MKLDYNLFALNLFYLVVIGVLLIFYFQLNEDYVEMGKNIGVKHDEFERIKNTIKKIDSVKTRDFFRYECNARKRIGGLKTFTDNAPDPLYRIDGAWYVCFDKKMAPADNCLVLSFGINDDYSFDQDMNTKYGCEVHSFDPFVEAPFFVQLRRTNEKLKNSAILEVSSKPKWNFYRIGISENKQSGDSTDNLAIGTILNFKTILKLIGKYEKIIDILKIDIEGEEKNIFMNMDMGYVCKYVKQLMFETHKNFNFKELSRLEKCFFLFHRHTRLFMHDVYNTPTGGKTEFQNGYQLNLSIFGNETALSEYMFVNGEFYFVNENFI